MDRFEDWHEKWLISGIFQNIEPDSNLFLLSQQSFGSDKQDLRVSQNPQVDLLAEKLQDSSDINNIHTSTD